MYRYQYDNMIHGVMLTFEGRIFLIHQYKSNGYNMVLDINSGSIHVVDDLVYDVISLLDESVSDDKIKESLHGRYSADEIEEALEELRELNKQGRTGRMEPKIGVDEFMSSHCA